MPLRNSVMRFQKLRENAVCLLGLFVRIHASPSLFGPTRRDDDDEELTAARSA
jgi:hypothetical protein